MIWMCRHCGFQAHLFDKYYWKCPRCSKPLHIVFHTTGELYSSRNIWERYRGFVPFIPSKTRGEGLTPLVIERENSHILLFKLEYLNPGGSFKDRGTALAVYYGHKMGYNTALVDTSGNTGISVALYSRLYGLKAIVIMPRSAPMGKKKAVSRLGGTVVEAEDRTKANELVSSYLAMEDVYYVAHLWNPLYIIGHSTISYEVFEEYGVPDYVISPVGSGGLLLAISYGFEQLLRHGLTRKKPKLIAVQGYSCQPVYREMYGIEMRGEESSLADGIMVYNPPRVSEIVDAVRASNGEVVLVGNSEIERAHKLLWESGFLVEPTSATVYAAYMKIKDRIPSNSSVLLVLTGSGLKTL